MRKWITLLMTLLAGCGSYANANNFQGNVDFEAGYRRDTIDWRYRFPSDDPFVTTSTKFKDLDIFQIALNGRTTICNNFYVRGNAYWGWILDGDFKRNVGAYFSADDFSSSDPYTGGDFHFGISDKHRSTINDQYVFGVSAAIGYPCYFCNCTMIVAPVIGYGFDEQNVRVDNRNVGFGGSCNSYLQDVSGGCCEQTFVSRWYGPFVGLDYDWRPCNTCFNVWAELEYHWGNFRGKRSNTDDYYGIDSGNRHSHNATAWLFGAGFDYDLCNCWTAGISVKFQDWAANRHHHACGDDSYNSGGRVRTNNKWRSYAINLTVGREF